MYASKISRSSRTCFQCSEPYNRHHECNVPKKCSRCGEHDPKHECIGYDAYCDVCDRRGHVTSMCFHSRRVQTELRHYHNGKLFKINEGKLTAHRNGKVVFNVDLDLVAELALELNIDKIEKKLKDLC
ncbi:ORF17 [Betabaculovirus altermyunipunctae]|uniref:ORF17 n=1 Tax=Betabaculovirus altermyunipunctae TaxID=3051996 RepID=A0A1S5YE89_9BBAC|nr:ORF17 [Betabaculovirus altermyunipunctae]AQQ80284.1 ORF17 [Betabaculovirus altermyunipunctae]